MDFGLMFFASADQAHGDKYSLLRTAAAFADRHRFCCVWTPERHFHPFGGLFPNPALTSCALAMITERVGLRAGSLVSPLHDPIRIAEEWAVVDNLSAGRVAVSFGSGWNAADFVLYPERYAHRQAIMYEQIAIVQQLWRGEAIQRTDSFGKTVEVSLYPRPAQPELPVWVTSSGSEATFVQAGSIGANVLTHMLGQDISLLSGRIGQYRNSRLEHGFDPKAGIVSLMLHTYVGEDLNLVRRTVRRPFREYLRSAISLERKAALTGGAISGGKVLPDAAAPAFSDDELLDLTFDRYFQTAGLMGTIETCSAMVQRLESIGVNEIACLIDFGIEQNAVLDGLDHLAMLAGSVPGPSEIEAFTADLTRCESRPA